MKRFLKRLALGVLLAAVPFSYVQAGNFVRSFTSVADEAGGLGNVKCSTLGTLDGAGIVYLSTGIEYWFYDHTATDAADGTHVRCKGYTTAGVWAQVKDEITPVGLGGTGASSLTDGGILLGSGTGPVTALGAAANGQIPIGDGSTDPVLANITESTDALSITNGPGSVLLAAHANLEAVADACAGVADPGVALYDSQNAGTDETCGTGDKLAGTISANCTDTTEDSEDCDIAINSMLAGTNTQRAMFDTSDGQWEFNYPVTAPSVDAGLLRSSKNASYNIETTESTVCRKEYAAAGFSGEIVFTLPATTLCATGSAKEFYFVDWDKTATDDLSIDPNGADKIWLDAVDCGAGDKVMCSSDVYNWIHIVSAGEGHWTVYNYEGTCVCE